MSGLHSLHPDFHKTLLDQLFDGVYFVDKDRRILYWNKAAERITGYPSSEVVGSFCRDNILCHVDCEGKGLCQGKCPMAHTIADGQLREVEVHLLHRDGHRLPVSVRTSPIRDPQGLIIGAVEIFSHSATTARTIEKMHSVHPEPEVDPETGLATRAGVSAHLRTRLLERSNDARHVGVVLLRIDRLESGVQGLGPAAKIRVLRAVSETLVRTAEPIALVGRWSNDEFMVVIADPQIPKLLSETNKLRALVEKCSVPVGSERLFVTTSVGATRLRNNDTLESIVERVTQLVDRSAGLGGGCVSHDY